MDRRVRDEKELLDITTLFADSDFDELRLEVGTLRLHLAKDSHGTEGSAPGTPGSAGRMPAPGGEPAVPAPSRPDTEKRSAQAAKTAPPAPPVQPPGRVEEGLIPIQAPLLGVFYGAPKPGAPPFVEPGSYVTEDETVCLIEVMKLFNAVKAGVRGRITRVCAQNAQLVRQGETLFLVTEERAPT